MDQILTETAGADRLIFASPLVMGFVHSSFKMVMDRMIPLLLPYIGIHHGEMHHYLRYDRSRVFGLLVENEELPCKIKGFVQLFETPWNWLKTPKVDF